MRSLPLSQPNPGVPGFGHFHEWSKSETSDLDVGEGGRAPKARDRVRGSWRRTPHPARCSPLATRHPLPQGERGSAQAANSQSQIEFSDQIVVVELLGGT